MGAVAWLLIFTYFPLASALAVSAGAALLGLLAAGFAGTVMLACGVGATSPPLSYGV